MTKVRVLTWSLWMQAALLGCGSDSSSIAPATLSPDGDTERSGELCGGDLDQARVGDVTAALSLSLQSIPRGTRVSVGVPVDQDTRHLLLELVTLDRSLLISSSRVRNATAGAGTLIGQLEVSRRAPTGTHVVEIQSPLENGLLDRDNHILYHQTDTADVHYTRSEIREGTLIRANTTCIPVTHLEVR
jgi:hypothetical protein